MVELDAVGARKLQLGDAGQPGDAIQLTIEAMRERAVTPPVVLHHVECMMYYDSVERYGLCSALTARAVMSSRVGLLVMPVFLPIGGRPAFGGGIFRATFARGRVGMELRALYRPTRTECTRPVCESV
eukprot:scaffold1399_cov410-Prasinococcus_capsulatus_cf.AAC.1